MDAFGKVFPEKNQRMNRSGQRKRFPDMQMRFGFPVSVVPDEELRIRACNKCGELPAYHNHAGLVVSECSCSVITLGKVEPVHTVEVPDGEA